MAAGPMFFQGQPNSPFVDYQIYAGQDAFIDLQFLDPQQNAVQPTSIQYRVDDLTNNQMMSGWLGVTPTGTSQELQIPAATLVMNRQWEGRQLCQVWIQAVVPYASAANGSVTVNERVIIELIGISTPS